MRLTAFIQLCVACAIFIAVSSGAKTWALSPTPGKVALTLGLHTACNLLMLGLVREIGMATAFSVSAVLHLIAVNAVAIAFYGEEIGTVEGTGLRLAVLAVALLTLDSSVG